MKTFPKLAKTPYKFTIMAFIRNILIRQKGICNYQTNPFAFKALSRQRQEFKKFNAWWRQPSDHCISKKPIRYVFKNHNFSALTNEVQIRLKLNLGLHSGITCLMILQSCTVCYYREIVTPRAAISPASEPAKMHKACTSNNKYLTMHHFQIS